MTELKSLDESRISFRDDSENHRYVVEIDGEPAGLAVYHLRGGRHFFVHTEVSSQFGGSGLGSRLATYALDDVRRQGGMVAPICPFIAAFIKRHPEYDDIVDRDIMERINRIQDSTGV